MFKFRSCSSAIALSVKYVRTNVTAQLVKELREKSGAPMMDCKKALSSPEVAGNIPKALDWLRTKGIVRAASNADRQALEGLIAVYIKGNKGTILEVNSETDFVGRNDRFQAFVTLIASTIHSKMDSGNISISDLLKMNTEHAPAKTIQDALGDVIMSIRENIVIRRAESFKIVEKDDIIASYVHGKIPICADADKSLAAHYDHIQLGKAGAVVSLQVMSSSSSEELSAVHETFQG